MPSETDCLNDALSQIGAARVTAIDDGSKNANFCQQFYPNLRDSLLRSHHWNFAMKRVELARDAAAPAFEFAFSYTLPADCLKVTEYNGASTDTSTLSLFEAQIIFHYRVEGRKLLTNDGQVKIVYISRVTDPNIWDAMFYQALAAMLASKLASAITKDEKKTLAKMQEGTHLLSLAMAVDGQEGSIEAYRTDDLKWGR